MTLYTKVHVHPASCMLQSRYNMYAKMKYRNLRIFAVKFNRQKFLCESSLPVLNCTANILWHTFDMNKILLHEKL